MNKDNDFEFLKKYNAMISELNKKPKIFKNLKQGDTIWYIRYSYRGNGKKTSNISIEQYDVHELSEYEVYKNADELIPAKYNIRVMKRVRVMTTFSSDHSEETGVWKEKIESTGIGFMYGGNRHYDNDMEKDIVERNDTIYCNYEVWAFDKEKALNSVGDFIKKRYNAYKTDCEEENKRINAIIKEINDEYENLINEIENETNRC